MYTDLIPTPRGGPIEIGYVDEKTGLWTPAGVKDHNLIFYSGADILGHLLRGDSQYVVNKMYIEFSNTTPSPPVNTNRAITRSYYTGLSAPVDYLRVNIDSTPILGDSSGSGTYASNLVTFFGITAGAVGVNGTTFSQGASSTVYGGALVASPTGVIGGDVIFARFYATAGNWVAKLNSTQIGIKWQVAFN